MTTEKEKKVDRQLSVWLPESFVDGFKQFMKDINEESSRITKIPEKEVVYIALKEYMDRHGKE